MSSGGTTESSIVKPLPRQLAFQDLEFGLFVHFGLRTFHPGHKQFDTQRMDLSPFDPNELDCGRWIRTAKDAGMRYAVMTAKHHDGFCNWPSSFTDYSVANTPWRNGKGDVVREFTDACHRHGLAIGLYYSPADVGFNAYGDEKAYDDYFVNQMSELLDGEYGEIAIVWFDGCGTEGHRYDWARIASETRRMQPDICIFNLGDPDFRWVGTEGGTAPSPCWNVAEWVETKDGMPRARHHADTETDLPILGERWLPAECDCMMRSHTWFYDHKDTPIKSVEQLIGLYYYSVGRGCNMLLNIGPDVRGLFPEEEEQRLLELGAEIRRRFGNPMTSIDDFDEVDGAWEWPSGERRETAMIDHVVLQEDLTNGEHVRRFRIDIWPEICVYPIKVYEGENIGHKAICPFPPARVEKVRVEITEATGPVSMRNIELHHAAGSG